MSDSSRYLPKFDPCDISRPEALRLYREALGAALSGTTGALDTLQTSVAAAVGALGAATGTVDKLLEQNPDPTTPNSLESLTTALGGFRPTTDADALEERVAEMFDLNVIGGVLLPQGAADLGGLRRLFQSLEITEALCNLPNLAQDFIFVTAYTETIETVVGEACGEPIIEFTVVERKIGENITIAKAAELRAVPESEVLIRFYWLDEIKTDRATQLRLKALGITGADLNAVITAPKETTRVFSTIVDTTHLTQLQQKLFNAEICRMMNRDDTRSNLNLAPSDEAVLQTVRSTLNTNTGTSRNRAGTDADAITPETSPGVSTPSGTQTDTGGSQPKAPDNVAPAGRAGDPALMFLATVNLARSLGLEVVEDNVLINGTPVELDDLPDGCTEIFNFVFESLAALQQFAGEAQTVMAEIFGLLSTGLQEVGVGVDFSTCLVSANLGLDGSLNLAIALPFEMATFLETLDTALTAAVEAINLIKKLLCLPQAVISMLFGGVCGFRPFNFDSCPPDILQAIAKLKNLLSIVTTLISSALSALQVIKADAKAVVRKSLDLKVEAECASAATPMAIALGLVGEVTTLLEEGLPDVGLAVEVAGQTIDVDLPIP